MTFREGDRVAVTGRFGDSKGTATVIKVLKSRVVLDNGDRYTLSGDKLRSDGTISRKIGQTISKAADNA